MNLSPFQLLYFSILGFAASLVIHIMTVMHLYLVSTSIMMIITAGVLIVWLQTSKNMKSTLSKNTDIHPWKFIVQNCPGWMGYFLYFLIVYAIANFALVMNFSTGSGYIDLSVSQPKLRGLSGFWLVFYMLGIMSGQALNCQSPEEKSADQ